MQDVFLKSEDAMKHCLYVTRDGYKASTEPQQNPYQSRAESRAGEEVVIEGLAFVLEGIFKHQPTLVILPDNTMRDMSLSFVDILSSIFGKGADKLYLL